MGFKIYRKIILIGLVFIFSTAVLCGCGAGSSGSGWEKALVKTAEKQMENVEYPAVSPTGGEWTVLALARSGVEVPDSYFEIYRTDLRKTLKDTGGILSDSKYTEYSRVDLALTALGDDPGDFDGYDLLKPLLDFDTVTKYGINGPAYALMALDSGAYEFSGDGTDVSEIRERYVDWIISQEKQGGGFSFYETADEADADMTAIVIQSLAPYKDDAEVSAVIDRGLDVLSELQDDDGYFRSFDELSCETLSQAIIAVSAYGVDCNTDERFVKNGNGMIDVLMTFYDGNGGFSHTLEGDAQTMSTEQALCALAAYDRFMGGKTALMDMTDVR